MEIFVSFSVFLSTICLLVQFSVGCQQQLKGYRAQEVCFDELGCFTNSGPPYAAYPPPNTPESMGLSIKLLTAHSPVLEEVAQGQPSQNFIHGREVKIIIHGFLTSARDVRMVELARSVVYECQCNVLIVDWSEGSFGTRHERTRLLHHYEDARRSLDQAISNQRVVSRMLGNFFVTFIHEHKLSFKDIHCIGEGLGAQLCAALSTTGHGVMKRISALNPFEIPSCGTLCLDKSDADYVDVIHTANGSSPYNSGTESQLGHADWYVNWGSLVPETPIYHVAGMAAPMACHAGSTYSAVARSGFKCTATLAIELYIVSIGDTCPFIGKSCESHGKDCTICTAGEEDSCIRMGYHSNRALLWNTGFNRHGGRFYVDVAPHSPFC